MKRLDELIKELKEIISKNEIKVDGNMVLDCAVRMFNSERIDARGKYGRQ